MHPTNKHRLATLAIALVTNHRYRRLRPPENRKMTFDMSWWAHDEDGAMIGPDQVNECGTSCCFLGYAPVVMPETRGMDEWGDVINWVIGKEAARLENFLFGASWKSIPLEAAARALFILEGNDPGSMSSHGGMAQNCTLFKLSRLSKPKMLARLQAFITQTQPNQ